MKRFFVIVAMLSLAACGGGGGGDVTSPSGAGQVPSVAGTYSGTIHWAANGVPLMDLPAQMTVVQAASQLTITGNLAGEPIAAVTGTLSSTGYFTSASGGAAGTYDPTCGTIVGVDASLTFSGRNAEFVEHDNTAFCGTWSFTGTLTR